MKRMNYIKILCFSAVITGLGSIVSCGDAKYDTLDTHAYIEEALSSTSQSDRTGYWRKFYYPKCAS